jgi:hypothetical protein
VSNTLHSGCHDIEALVFVPTDIVQQLLWPMPLILPTDAPPARASRWDLSQNVPNPFNPTTRITVIAPETGQGTLAVYDPTGRCVTTLYRGPIAAGSRNFTWDGRDDAGARMASGVYFCRLQAAGIERTVRMVLMK